jgi:hypothetical protein
MSCYEWERGSIQIPSAAWAKFKADLRAAYNKQAERDFALVEKLHATVKDLIKGKRGVNIAQVLSTEAHAMIESRGYGYYATSQEKYAFKLFDTEDILRKLFVDGKLYAPKKKDFPLANGKTVSFGADYEGRISLRDTDRTVPVNPTWGRSFSPCSAASSGHEALVVTSSVPMNTRTMPRANTPAAVAVISRTRSAPKETGLTKLSTASRAAPCVGPQRPPDASQ